MVAQKLKHECVTAILKEKALLQTYSNLRPITSQLSQAKPPM